MIVPPQDNAPNSLLLQAWKAQGDLDQLNQATDDHGNLFSLYFSEYSNYIETHYEYRDIKQVTTPRWVLAIAGCVEMFFEGVSEWIITTSMELNTQQYMANCGFSIDKNQSHKTTIQRFFEETPDIALQAKNKIIELERMPQDLDPSIIVPTTYCPSSKVLLSHQNVVVLEHNDMQILLSRQGVSKILIEGECVNAYGFTLVTREKILKGTFKRLTTDNYKVNVRIFDPLEHYKTFSEWTIISNRN